MFLIRGEWEQHADLVEQVWETFRRDGRLAGIGEELGVIDLLLADKRRHPGADTKECGVCVAHIHRDVDGALLLPVKDLRRGDDDDVLVVRVEVGHMVKEYVREHVMCELVCERRSGRIVSPSWWTMSCWFPLKENIPTQHSSSFSLMMSEMSFMSQRTARWPQGEVPRELNELGANHQQVVELPLALLDTDILGLLRLEAVLQALVRVEVVDILIVTVRELVDLEDDWNVFRVRMVSSLMKKGTLMGLLRFVGGSRGCCRGWRRMADSLVRRALSGLTLKQMFVLVFCMSFM